MKKLFLLSTTSVLLFSCGYSNKPNPQPLISETPQTEVEQKTQPIIQTEKAVDSLVGSYKCDRSKDMYVFHADGTGEFFAMGSTSSSSFTWNRFVDDITILYKVYGEQRLKFNLSNKTITEKSPSLGTLVFRKIN